MTSDLDLLRQFARENSQDAFAEIVRRHLNLVYSAARRQVRSPQLAEEVAQSVFADLARDAGKVSGTGFQPVNSLTPWLYTVTRRTAIDAIRKESRRQLREQIAAEMNNMNATANDWTQIEPLLDDAMAALDETDRSAILLRYFENKNLREVGEALGASEDAAQKRVSRAVERLREFFSKRNVMVGASGMAILISTNAVQATPASLAAVITGKALATTTTITVTKAIIMTTLQKTFVIASVGVLTGAGIYEAVHLAQKQTGTQTVAKASNPEPPNSAGDYVPREKYAFAGYSTPEAAIKSIFWVQSRGDVKTSLDSLSPKIRSLLETELKSVSERNVSSSMIKEDENILGYRIADQEKISDDKIVVTVSVNDVRPRHGKKKMQLVRINSEWKYDGGPDEPKQ
jgi:RNA polymerase sigma factor (sigma-70 family)